MSTAGLEAGARLASMEQPEEHRLVELMIAYQAGDADAFSQLYAALATLRVGMDVLQRDEDVRLERLFAHGGLFKTAGVAQAFLAAALDTPVCVGDDASEGGAWGAAVLAAFTQHCLGDPVSLGSFLDAEVFRDAQLSTVEPQPEDVHGFSVFMDRYVQALPVQRAAVQHG
jgi:sugar (pentulose or hexulose) kinase